MGHQPGPGVRALSVILAAQLVIPLSIAGTAVALPGIAAELGSAAGPLQWVVNAFNVAFAVMTLVWGAAADRVGHDRVFRIGVVIVLLASLASALSGSLQVLDVARALAGAGAAAVLTGATSVLSLAWEGQARARAFAIFGTVNGVGLALGPTVCGVIAQLAGWRAIFWLPVGVLLLALLGSRAVPRVGSSRAEAARLLDVSLLRNRGFMAMVLVPVAGAVGFVTFLTYLPAAFSAVRGWSVGARGAVMLLATVPVIVSPSVVAWLITRRGITSGQVVGAAMSCLVAGAVAMFGLAPGVSWVAAVPGMVLVGLGFGLPLGLVDGEALAAVPSHASGSAAGLLNFARIGSEAVAVAAYSAALTGLVRRAIDDRVLADQVAAGGPGAAMAYASALHVVALVAAAVVAVLALVVRRLRRHPQAEQQAA